VLRHSRHNFSQKILTNDALEVRSIRQA